MSKKFEQMRSALDTHEYEAQPYKAVQDEPMSPEKTLTLSCKKSTAVKVRDLSSNVFGTGDSLTKYAQPGSETILVDLDIKGLSENI